MEPPLHPTLRTLLARRDLRLALVSEERMLADGALDQPMRWVHSSDLVDPTPFLADDLVLLTTGTQFPSGDHEGIAAYVERLVQRGVNGLGFGSGVHSQGIPPELVAACQARGLPLFEVPYDVPFIAIARGHAEAIAAQTYARRTWALEAQRALAIAALRPRGLESALTELSRRLGCWVGLFDATGLVVHEHPIGAGGATPAISEAASALLQRGSSASRAFDDAEAPHTLFTLGRTGHLRGAIAIAASAHDAETRAVVTSVIAMAGLSMEQGVVLARERRRLNAQLLESLLTDDPTLARRVLGSLPAAPIVVAVGDAAQAAAVTEWWDRRRSEGTASFLAVGPEGLTICISAAAEGAFDELAAQLGVRVGVSAASDYRSFSQAHAQAVTALGRGTSGVTRYADAAGSGMLDALASEESRLLAAARLAPLRVHDAKAGSDLEATLRSWLEHDARIDAAADAMGVHRHTIRARIAQAAQVLGVDLSSFPARAELWAALQLAATG
ncbi:PucR family transcriptional regulator [Microbacterium sp. H1-D42]|uniref:PucR family transcriptional regulator n=1 Tax=Microbacterium sp. H1-D42 TaxID=2925844 RepID=UPI001F52E04C|nr:PucR family transcriptional regulator [Microbacterium sp. H1-D42]UNK71668.1 PucR family transcriptional regulator [Microbacterium sp. H1-D42]